MDKVVDEIAALGVPGVVLLVAMAATGWTGGAAITTALAALGGPLGMLGGIAGLVVLALISRALVTYGFERLFRATVNKLRRDGVSADEIRKRIQGYPISGELKAKIFLHLEQYA